MLTVDLPTVWKPLLAASGFAFAVSLGEFGATSFLARDERPRCPSVIYRLIGHPGELNYGMALAASVVLAPAAVVMLAVERLRAPWERSDVLSLESVSVAHDGVPAVHDADLDLDGEVLAVLGPSGSGKSTLLRAVAGLEQAAGQVRWDGTDLAGYPDPPARLRADVPGRPALRRTSPSRATSPTPCGCGASAAERRGRPGRELLALVGLEGYDDRLPGTLSGGERQRVALARVLAASRGCCCSTSRCPRSTPGCASGSPATCGDPARGRHHRADGHPRPARRRSPSPTGSR